MARLNFARREIEVKIVYYGPAFSGKTTNVEVVHRLLPASQRGELHALQTDQDRTIFFDYLPLDIGEISGLKARIKLFTVPGQTFYKETRRVVLQGADAVVFVADSDPMRRQANLESFADLEENLQAHGIDIATFPMVIQLNKRDHMSAVPVADMVAELNPFDVQVVEAVARDNTGVLHTLKYIAEAAAAHIQSKVAGRGGTAQVTAIDRADAEDDRAVVDEHMQRIAEVRPAEQARVASMQATGAAPAVDPNAFLATSPSGARPEPVRAVPAPASAPPTVAQASGVRATASPGVPTARGTGVGGVPEPTPDMPPAPPAWQAAATATLVSGSVGVLIGIAIGWFAARSIAP